MYRQRLGDAVKEARMELDLSQNTLAERSHVSLRTISDIENYKANWCSLCAIRWQQLPRLSMSISIGKQTSRRIELM